MMFDDERFALWSAVGDPPMRTSRMAPRSLSAPAKPPLRESGLLPRGGIARFYGIAKIYKSGPIYEEIWNRLIEPEKNSDPEKRGFGVLIKVERTEDLSGTQLAI
jgi:hypothetical protein